MVFLQHQLWSFYSISYGMIQLYVHDDKVGEY